MIGVGGAEIAYQSHELSRQAGHPFGTHGVALVGHGRAADLILLKGLFLNLEVTEQTQVHGKLVGRGADAGQGLDGLHVELTGIGLTGNCKNLGKSKLCSDKLIHLAHLIVVSLKEFDKGGLGADRTLGAPRLDLRFQVLKVVEIHEKILKIQGVTLTDRGGLSRLIMGVPQGCEPLVLARKGDEIGDNIDQALLDELQTLFLEQQIGVAANKLRSCAEMDDRLGSRALEAIGIDMGHDIMADLFFLGRGQLEIDIRDMGPQFIEHGAGDEIGKTHLMLGFGQGDPAAAPGFKLGAFGKKLLHLAAGVAADQRLLIDITIHDHLH